MSLNHQQNTEGRKMSDSIDDFLLDIGVSNEPETPEDKLYREFTEGKHPRINTLTLYWLKHELHVYNHLMEKNWHVSKLNGSARSKVEHKELCRALLQYYFLMTNQPRFEGEEAIRRGMAVDMDKFLDRILEYPTIKKLIDSPTLWI